MKFQGEEQEIDRYQKTEGKPRGKKWVEMQKRKRGIEMVIAGEGDA